MTRFLAFLLVLLSACTSVREEDAPNVGQPTVDLCDKPQPDPKAEPTADRTYMRRASAGVTEGDRVPAEALAMCDAGDEVVAGSCSWGKAPGTVIATTAGPFLDGDDETTPIGWLCAGVPQPDLIGQSAVYGFVVCRMPAE